MIKRDIEAVQKELAETEERLSTLLRKRARELLIKAASREPTQGIRWLPGGWHQTNGLDLLVNERTAAAAELQRQFIVNRGDRPFFDFNHLGDEHSFYPTKFIWNDGSVWALGEWSKRGRQLVSAGVYHAFSPQFHIDTRKWPAQVIAYTGGDANMGAVCDGLPAFKELASGLVVL